MEYLGAWLSGSDKAAEVALSLCMVIAALVVCVYVMRALKRRAAASKNPWDDVLVGAVNTPLTVFLVVFAIHEIFHLLINLQPEERIARLAALFPNVKTFVDIIPLLITTFTFFWIILRAVSAAETAYRRAELRVGGKKIDAGTLYIVFRVARAFVFVIGALTVINSVGVSISGILAFGGIGGVIIGFAAKDTLANFFSGMLIFWERPFVIGDWIRQPSNGIEGVVEQIGWRTTQIRTFDQRPLYVPNSLFFNNVIENPQRMTNRRIYEYMGVRYDDMERLPALLADVRRMLRDNADIDQNQIQMVNFDRYGASSLDFFIYAMTKTTNWIEFHRAKEEVFFQVAALVKKHGCEFAFPTRTIHHVNAPPPPPAG